MYICEIYPFSLSLADLDTSCRDVDVASNFSDTFYLVLILEGGREGREGVREGGKEEDCRER